MNDQLKFKINRDIKQIDIQVDSSMGSYAACCEIRGNLIAGNQYVTLGGCLSNMYKLIRVHEGVLADEHTVVITIKESWDEEANNG
ncbi:MAG: hypothetical protein QN716_01640 [Nitrososphaeraceae archaeon]|nr:hypothetical protein [Nitrososphaeraceae archaeon]